MLDHPVLVFEKTKTLGYRWSGGEEGEGLGVELLLGEVRSMQECVS